MELTENQIDVDLTEVCESLERNFDIVIRSMVMTNGKKLTEKQSIGTKSLVRLEFNYFDNGQAHIDILRSANLSLEEKKQVLGIIKNYFCHIEAIQSQLHRFIVSEE